MHGQNPTLGNGEEGVGWQRSRRAAATRHLRGVIDSVMQIAMMLQFVVSGKIVSKDRALGQHVFLDHADQGLFVDVEGSFSNDAALASFPFNDADQ